MAKILTYEQARSYIAGETEFDKEDHDLKHVDMLVKSVRQWLDEYGFPTGARKENLLRTVENYIRHNQHVRNVCKLKDLYEEIINR